MDINKIVLVITCVFSGISVIVSFLSLSNTRKIANKNGYINTVTASRERWASSLQSNGSSYLAISLHDYDDDKELKSKMKEIQNHIYKFVASKNSDSLENEIAEVQKLKDEIYLLINRKHQEEWKKQKYEVALEK
jgi:flagellar basal body-associated protein FliL